MKGKGCCVKGGALVVLLAHTALPPQAPFGYAISPRERGNA